jgi:hypothetical protein
MRRPVVNSGMGSASNHKQQPKESSNKSDLIILHCVSSAHAQRANTFLAEKVHSRVLAAPYLSMQSHWAQGNHPEETVHGSRFG